MYPATLIVVAVVARRVLLLPLLLLQDLLLPRMLPDQARHPLRLGLDRFKPGLLRHDPGKLVVGPRPSSSYGRGMRHPPAQGRNQARVRGSPGSAMPARASRSSASFTSYKATVCVGD